MRNIMTIFKRDFKSYFISPIAYVVIALFLVLIGIIFFLLTSSFLQYSAQLQWQAARFQQTPPPINVNQMILRPMLQNMSVFTLFFIPMITMRSFSEDKRSGTMELLMTSPATTMQIVLGKFLSAFCLYAIMVLATFVYPLVIIGFGNPDVTPILTAYAGILFLGAASIGIGIWISAMTENQIIAAVGTLVSLLLLWFVGWFSMISTSFLGDFFRYMSIFEHFEDFSKGVFDSGHIVYYLSLCGIMLFLSHQWIESLKWRS